MLKTGWILSILFTLFMLVASIAPKLLGAQVAADAITSIGWSTQYLLTIGVLELLGTILFIIPRTAFLGAILMTGIIGGAIASHLRANSPIFSHTLFGIYLGILMWAGLWLRDEKLRRYIF